MVGEQHVGTKLSLANGALGMKSHAAALTRLTPPNCSAFFA
jgi:hypothetical protein